MAGSSKEEAEGRDPALSRASEKHTPGFPKNSGPYLSAFPGLLDLVRFWYADQIPARDFTSTRKIVLLPGPKLEMRRIATNVKICSTV